MSPSRLLALALLSLACLAASVARGSEERSSPLARLSAAWSLLDDYSMTIETTEWTRGTAVQEVLRYAFRKPALARLEVVAGPRRGAVLVWRGGPKVVAYQRGFLLFKIVAGVTSARVTSPRGNGILTPNLGDVLDCFAAHGQNVRESAGPSVDGAPSDAIALDYRGGSACPDDSSQDRAVTRDVLYVSRDSGYVVERERYEGDTLVERYLIRDLVVNSNLPDSLFR
ncbi:MAG: hypothetical protein ACLPYS_17495 [Vulcanimicrobiaceae bacterium]